MGPRPARRRSGVRQRRERGAGEAAAAPPRERLQKMLSRFGIASRREAEGWIRAGRLTINGLPATLGARVGVSDKVQLDGRPVRGGGSAGPKRVFLCHRSPGEPLIGNAAGSDTAGLPPLTERIPRRAGRRFIAVSPMPHIDGGLELVTADGELAARLQRAVHALVGEYGVRVRGELSQEQLRGILGGALDSGPAIAVESCEPGGGEGANRWYTIRARGASGKQVRQLVERQGGLVSRVLRTRLGSLSLVRSLPRGRFRELTEAELDAVLGLGVELLPGDAAAGRTEEREIGSRQGLRNRHR